MDEINLAPPETLERLTGVLEGEEGSICLTEKGEIELVKLFLPGFLRFQNDIFTEAMEFSVMF